MTGGALALAWEDHMQRVRRRLVGWEGIVVVVVMGRFTVWWLVGALRTKSKIVTGVVDDGQ